MLNFIQDEIKKLSSLLLHIQNDQQFLHTVTNIVNLCVNALQAGNKMMFAGNGGSAADAQHLATELVTRLRYERPGLPAIALTTDTSLLTAAGNDYAFDRIFARQVEALGNAGDVLFAFSTSGKSPNIVQVLKTAGEKEVATVGFTGSQPKAEFVDHCDIVLKIPSQDTAKIQECHILLGHIICALIEESIFGSAYNPNGKVEKDVAMMSS